MVLDTKTYWLTECQSQRDFDLTNSSVFLSGSDKVDSPGEFSSWEYKDKNGAWIVKLNWERIGTKSTQEYKRLACEKCKVILEV
jgi:hypothetical protein